MVLFVEVAFRLEVPPVCMVAGVADTDVGAARLAFTVTTAVEALLQLVVPLVTV
jgi:hypothetical protein